MVITAIRTDFFRNFLILCQFSRSLYVSWNYFDERACTAGGRLLMIIFYVAYIY